MSELRSFAEFIRDYGWLAVSIIIMAAWIFGVFHSDGEFKRESSRADKAETARDAAIKLSQDMVDIMERGQRDLPRRERDR